ncbi:hypothetical protein M409DRAFT_54749 [Zasmidium cellare ATCC 36951]|uniref:MmgE/PrpD family protein n=1 Tax=Zasmidium cellare ATCC 36951 TaxID=1080233 RepID=A0A6A6CIX4_ZASCE|nr:uncharacterized protein M409DRAFT_54749 [Zasmidium cellare ATCC 36951]KAF2166991.1 hypothetical protein M409DRAFT_54749 [Zasmidium cellare ATCC 36951]
MAEDIALESIADFVVRAQKEGAPQDAIEASTNVLLDSLACIYAGMDSPGPRAAAAIPQLARSPRDEGTVVGSTQKVTLETAAFWNSSMIRYADCNDSMTAGHPSDMLGPLIAVAGARELSGRTLLISLAVAYEVFHLLMLRHRTYHKHKGALVDNLSVDQGFFVATGVAAALAHMLDYSHQQTKTAVSLAACHGLPLRAQRAGELSHYKGVATAVSARAAVFSCQLAEAGLTAPPHPFEGRHGYIEIMEGKAGPMNLEPFGTWAIKGTILKFFPSTASTQIGIWCAKELREKIDVSQIKDVLLHASHFSWHESGSEPAKWNPKTHETADHSLPYTFTMGLLDGNVNLDSYSDATLASDRWRPLISKIRVQADDKIESEWPDIFSIRALATLKDGTTHEVYARDPKGHPNNPMNREDICAKFHNFAGPILGTKTDDMFHYGGYDWRQRQLQDVFRELRGIVTA